MTTHAWWRELYYCCLGGNNLRSSLPFETEKFKMTTYSVSRALMAIGAKKIQGKNQCLKMKTYLVFSLLAILTVFQARASSHVAKSMQALRAIDVSNGSVFTNDSTVHLLDYYEPSQAGQGYGRGGGFFRWRQGITAADDGGRYVEPAVYGTNSGRWERMLNGAVPNVKMWGAIGNGQINEFEWDAFQNAVNACKYPWAGELLIPSGLYYLTNTVVFPSQLHIRGEGIGNNTVIFMPVGIGKDIFRTTHADNALKGGLYQTGQSYPLLRNQHGESVDFDHGLIFENMFVGYDDPSNEVLMTNSVLVVCMPGEAAIIRNIHTAHGAYGIRCLGVGGPGLKVQNVGVFWPTIAGIGIEPLVLTNGNKTGVYGGPVTLTSVSSDSFSNNKAPTASLLRVAGCQPAVSVYDFKAEGEFGAGVFYYNRPNGGFADFGSLRIVGGTYNGTANYGSPHDLVVLDTSSTESFKSTPAVSLEQLNLFGTRYLIRDNVASNHIDADITVYDGLAQSTAKLPLHYQGYDLGDSVLGKTSRLIIGQTAYSYLYATNSGWYRVMVPLPMGAVHLAGSLVVSGLGRESMRMEVDVTTGSGSPQINVTRAAKLTTGRPVVTQARAFYYWEPARNGYWAGVDIYVQNPITSAYREKEKRFIITHDLNGVEGFDSGIIQLLSPIRPASLPTNAVSTVVNTYR
jgi:hypothetical protein